MAAPSEVSSEHSEPDGRLPRTVKVLGAVSFAQDAGSEMMYPFLPTFITGVLGAPVVAVGVAEGLADATAAGMKLVAGRLAASGRRRRWIAAGYGLATVGKVIVALAFVWPVVLLGRVVDRFGKGIRGVPRDALIADAVPPGLVAARSGSTAPSTPSAPSSALSSASRCTGSSDNESAQCCSSP